MISGEGHKSISKGQFDLSEKMDLKLGGTSFRGACLSLLSVKETWTGRLD